MAVERLLGSPASVLEWARAVVPQAEVTDDLGERASAVAVYALGLAAEQQAAADQPGEPLRFRVRYLVASANPEAWDALTDLLVAARQQPGWTIDLEPLPAEMWLALDVRPCPSFVLEVQAARTRPAPDRAPLARGPLDLKITRPRDVEGMVVTPSGQGIPAARVELVGQGRVTTTDAQGRFAFTAVPGETDVPLRLRVLAKGQKFSKHARLDSSEASIITCELEGV